MTEKEIRDKRTNLEYQKLMLTAQARGSSDKEELKEIKKELRKIEKEIDKMKKAYKQIAVAKFKGGKTI